MLPKKLIKDIEYLKKSYKKNTLSVADCENFLNSLVLTLEKHSNSENSRFLEYIGKPDSGMKIIHVAGTNGKGSVCNYLSSILLHSGYKTGMFTSPHLVRITERFVINGEEISDKIFIETFIKILYEVESFEKKETESSDYFPTYFEYLFFMAMILFRGAFVDYLVLETGLGGLLDVTNTVNKPVLSVITEIGMDHMSYLGDSYEDIAFHKAGIIKDNVPLVFFDKRPECTKIITDTAKEKHAKLISVSDKNIKNVMIVTNAKGNKYVDFCYDSEYYNYVGLRLHSAAKYQAQNASLAIESALLLKDMGAKITRLDIIDGLLNTVWPCRMEEIRPGFIIDGAHNTDGMEAFLKSAEDIAHNGRKILLFGAVSDKQYMQMASMIGNSKIFDIICVACLRTKRSLDKDSLKAAFSCIDNVYLYENVEDALCYIDSIKTDDDIIFAAGSLYLAGQLRETYD